jgi:ECF transporter S component (folate family)
MRSRQILVRLSFSALMVAASILLCRYLGFSRGDAAWRVEIGFLPIVMIGIFCGPMWSAAGYGAADCLGSLLTTGMNPFILGCKILTGLIFGLTFYRRRLSLWRILITMTVVALVVEIALMTPIFVFQFGYAFRAALWYRLVTAAVNLPIRVVLLCLLRRVYDRALFKYTPYFYDRKREDND